MTGKRRQDTYAAFESNIVKDLQKVMSNRYESEMRLQNALSPLVNDIKTSIDSLEPTKEFGLFVAAFPKRLIYEEPTEESENIEDPKLQGSYVTGAQPQSFQRTPDTQPRNEYDTDPSVDVVYEGELSMKRGILLTKSWRKEKCVITGTGFLHSFASNMNIRRLKDEVNFTIYLVYIQSDPSLKKPMQHYEPEFSLCLWDCILQPHPIPNRDDCEIELEEMGSTGLFSKGNTIHVVRFRTISILISSLKLQTRKVLSNGGTKFQSSREKRLFQRLMKLQETKELISKSNKERN